MNLKKGAASENYRHNRLLKFAVYGKIHHKYPKNRKWGHVNNPTGSADKLKALWAEGSPDRERLLKTLEKRDMSGRALKALIGMIAKSI
jgi:hypothetical protein